MDPNELDAHAVVASQCNPASQRLLALLGPRRRGADGPFSLSHPHGTLGHWVGQWNCAHDQATEHVLFRRRSTAIPDLAMAVVPWLC